VLLIIQEIPDILHINLRCLLVNLITDFSPCDVKVLILSVSFNPVAFLQITVINDFLQPMSVIEERCNASAHVTETGCMPVMQ
jgi:hypothetical protein